ncbi:hypothetical protein D3C71_1396890 [compost metagenome]
MRSTLSAMIMSLISYLYQSSEMSRPCTQRGLQTRPAVVLLEVSGFRFGLAPETNWSPDWHGRVEQTLLPWPICS